MWGNSRLQGGPAGQSQSRGQGLVGGGNSYELGDGNGSSDESAVAVGHYGGGHVDGNGNRNGQLDLHRQYQQQLSAGEQRHRQQQQDMPSSSSSNGENSSSPWSRSSTIGGSGSASVHYNYEFNYTAATRGGSAENLSMSSHLGHGQSQSQSPGSSNGHGHGHVMENNDHQQHQLPMISPPIYLQSRPSTAIGIGYRPSTAPSHKNHSYANFNSGCNLIVNYIPQFFTDRNLYDLFIPFGIILSVKVMKDRKSGYSFGFGFVNYEKEQAAREALFTMNGTQVQNKRLKVSYARPASEEIKNTNLYITSIPRHWNEEDMYNLFAYFGEIVHLNLLRDQGGNSRGVAFVRFAYRWEADKAIKELHLMKPEGAQDCMKVRLAEDHGKQKAAFMAGFELANKKNGIGRFRNQPFGLGWNTPQPNEDQNMNMNDLLQTEVHPIVAERRQRRLQQERQRQQQLQHHQQQQQQQQMQQPAEFHPSFPVFESAPAPPPSDLTSPTPSETPRRPLHDQSSPIYYK